MKKHELLKLIYMFEKGEITVDDIVKKVIGSLGGPYYGLCYYCNKLIKRQTDVVNIGDGKRRHRKCKPIGYRVPLKRKEVRNNDSSIPMS